MIAVLTSSVWVQRGGPTGNVTLAVDDRPTSAIVSPVVDWGRDCVVLAVSPIQVIILLIIFGGYLAPAIIAFARHHHNKVAITVLNVLVGWTFLGWIAALVWSFTNPAPAVASPPAHAAADGVAPKFDSKTGRPIRRL